MPLYEYRCGACSRQLEELRDIREMDEPARCPCGGRADRIFAAGFRVRVSKSTATYHGADPHTYDPEKRCPIPSYARHLTPDQYEAAHEKSFRAAEKRTAQWQRDGVLDKDSENVGRIPSAEFFARVREKGVQAALDPGYWKAKGRIFNHARKRVKTKD